MAAFPQVRVERRAVPGDWPAGPGRFDLVIFSEMLYYLGDGDLRQTLDVAIAALSPGGALLAVHWRIRSPRTRGPVTRCTRRSRRARG